MKAFVIAAVVSAALVVGASDVYAFAWGGGSSSARASASVSQNGGNASVPEPSALYAVGSAIALLGGAGWYIRRRK